MGYPVISTWCKAIDKGYFRGWNGLTSDRERKFIRPSPASEPGHMDQRRAYLRSTKQSPNTSSTPMDHMLELPQAPNNDKTNMVYMSTVEVDGQLFTDQTGCFSVTSNRGNNYIDIFYAVDPNFIKSYPIKFRHRRELLKAHTDVYQFLRTRGHRPQLHRLDNETSKDVENFITENNAAFQYTPPDMHRTNIAERAIRTWKNHFVAIRAGTPSTYCLLNWCKDIEQTDITLNMLYLHHKPPSLCLRSHRITKATQHLIRTIDGHPDAPDDELQAIQNLRDLLTGATTSHKDTTPTTEPISIFHEEAPPSLAPTLTHLVSPDPSPLPIPTHISPQPLHTFPPARVPNQPNVIPFEEHEYAPSTHPAPRYNLRSRAYIVLSAIAMIGEAHVRGMIVSAVIDNETGDSLEYRHLIKHPKYQEIWSRSYANELGRLTNGIRDIPGTNTMQYIRKSDIPKDRLKSITYSKIVVVKRPQKTEKELTRLTVVGTYIDYPGNTAVPTSDLTTAKLLFNSVISTAEIIEKYKLDSYNEHGWIYVRIDLGMYSLLQAGILANKLLAKRLAKAGYYQCQHTQGLWRHVWRPITFCLVVDDFGIKTVGLKHAKHLQQELEMHYECSMDWKGELFCGVRLNWDYKNRTVRLSMPNFVRSALHKFAHPQPAHPQHSPYKAAPITYGSTTQENLTDDTPSLSPDKIKFIQQVVGTFLFFGRAVDPTLAAASSSIASRQSKGTEATLQATRQLLDYVATHPNPSIQYLASNMILALDTDGSYLSELGGKSRAAAYMFLTKKDDPDFHNGAVLILSSIIKHVMASASETEIASLFYGCNEAIPLRITLEEMEHPQPGPTPVTTDNSTAVGLTLKTMIPKASKSMDMRFQLLKCRRAQSLFRYLWAKGTKTELTIPANTTQQNITCSYVPDMFKTSSQSEQAVPFALIQHNPFI
eukprot:CCRYP_015155-RA/>CCRYP_015155-RA protein AED:0.23 eAED:0.17 QI:0/0/0/1/1/1/3/0/935